MFYFGAHWVMLSNHSWWTRQVPSQFDSPTLCFSVTFLSFFITLFSFHFWQVHQALCPSLWSLFLFSFFLLQLIFYNGFLHFTLNRIWEFGLWGFLSCLGLSTLICLHFPSRLFTSLFKITENDRHAAFQRTCPFWHEDKSTYQLMHFDQSEAGIRKYKGESPSPWAVRL